MLKQVKFKTDYRCFTKNEKLKFVKGVNIVVGDQGTGKSSLLGLLAENNTDILDINADLTKTAFFDSENHNPRKESYLSSGFEVKSRFMSHGQCQYQIMQMMKKAKTPTCFLCDEPDTALSIRSCVKLASLFKEMSRNGHQVIASVHNIVVIASFGYVLDIENRRRVSSKVFLRNILPKPLTSKLEDVVKKD